MERIYILLLSALFVTGCTKTEEIRPDGDPVPVTFNLGTELGIDQNIEVRPVTRAQQIVTELYNPYRMLFLKKIDSRWILHRIETSHLKSGLNTYNKRMKVTADFVPDPYRTELTPGRYRIVTFINPDGGKWNDDLHPGAIIADENEPQKTAPAALTYRIETSNRYVNYGERYLGGEIFVGTADFTVSKSGTIGQSPDRQVSVTCKRRVARFRILLKDKEIDGINNALNTENYVRTLFTAKENKVFCDGIDALGNPYYNKANPTYAMKVNVTCNGNLYVSPVNGENYMMINWHSNVPSYFWFTDPNVEVPFDLKLESITERAYGPIRFCNEQYPLVLKNNAVTGIVYEADGTFYEQNGLWHFGLRQSCDDARQPEDPALLFDPFYEWNCK